MRHAPPRELPRWRAATARCVLITILLVLLPSVASAAPPSVVYNTSMQKLTMCHFFFGAISDLGWTFTYNQGRLDMLQKLSDEFPNVTFESIAFPNVAQLPTDTTSRRAAIRMFIYSKRCSVVLSNNDQLLGGRNENNYYAALYPNVSFVLLGEPWLSDHAFPNRVYIANDFTGGYYVAGAAAGAQSRSCIAFFAAWDSETDPTSSFAGFLLGVRRESATIPVHVISQNSWYDPPGDRILTDLFVDTMGCDVIARFSDPYGVDARVSDIGDANVVSIGCHSNLQEFVGDSVLTSVYIDWTVSTLPAIRSLLINGSLNQRVKYFPGFNDSAIVVAHASPGARAGVDVAANNAAAHLRTHANVVCGSIRLRNGGYLAYTNGSSCKIPESNINDFIIDAFTVTHPDFQGPTTCRPGTYHEYQFSVSIGQLQLLCIPCAPNFISAVAGADMCTPCRSGEVNDDTFTVCIAPPLMPKGAIAGLVVGAIVLVALALAAAVWQHAVHVRNSVAPRSAPMCLIHTNMEGAAVLWRTEPELMRQVAKQHDAIVRQVLANNHAYEIAKTEDQFVVATQSALDGLIVALEIQREMMATVWPATLPRVLWPTLRGRRSGGRHPLKPFSFNEASSPEMQCWNGPRVSIGLYHCREEATSVSYNWLEQRYTYIGPDPDAAARLGHIAQGGQIVVTQDTLDAVMIDPHYELILAHDVHIRVWGRECNLHPSPPLQQHLKELSHDGGAARVDNEQPAAAVVLVGSPVALVPPQVRLSTATAQNPEAVWTQLTQATPAAAAPAAPSADQALVDSAPLSPTTGTAPAAGVDTATKCGEYKVSAQVPPQPPMTDLLPTDMMESTSLYSITPVELSLRTFPVCPIGLPPFRAADMALPPPSNTGNPLSGGATTPGATTTAPGLSSYIGTHHNDDPYNATTNSSALSSALGTQLALSPVTISVLVLRLLQWVGPAHRRSLVRVLLDKLGKHNLERHQGHMAQLFQPFPGMMDNGSPAGNLLAKHRMEERILRGGVGQQRGGVADESDRGSKHVDVIPEDPEAPQWRNPKRLAAALAVALTEAFDEGAL